MVRLTMTPNLVQALVQLEDSSTPLEICDDPPLDRPAVGKPISHEQIWAVSKSLKQLNEEHRNAHSDDAVSHLLDSLLRGSRVYIEPPKPRNEPVHQLRSSASNTC